MKSTRVLATAGLSLGLVMALQSGCAQNTAVKQAPTANLEAAPPVAQAPAAQATTAQNDLMLSVTGKVVEVLNAGGYTYVKVEKEGKTNWAAMSSSFPAKVGDEISLKQGMVMKNFTSKTLNRTFEAIVFTDGPTNQAAENPHDKMDGAKSAEPAAAQAAAPPAPAVLSGKVVETLEGGGYTYINVENDGKTTWFAIPATKVAVGQQVEVQPGMPMQNFTSKSLNRSFERIDFSAGLVTEGGSASAATKGAIPAGHPPMGGKPEAGKDAAAAAGSMPAGHAPVSAKPEEAKGVAAAPATKGMGHGTMARGREMVPVSGKVLEAKSGGGYTYVEIEQKDGSRSWAAVPDAEVKVGQELKLQPGNEMKNFTSKTMGRTFDSLIFSPGIEKN